MALPNVIRDGDKEIATVHEGPQPHESDLVAHWKSQPVEIGIAHDVPELQKHWMLMGELLRLAEQTAIREGAVRRRASEEYLSQLSLRLLSILVDSDLYRPISRQQAKRHERERRSRPQKTLRKSEADAVK